MLTISYKITKIVMLNTQMIQWLKLLFSLVMLLYLFLAGSTLDNMSYENQERFKI